MKNLLDIRATDPAGGNFDEHFAITDFGDRDFFDANDALFAENARPHGLGDGAGRAGGL
jgi:hypothetical protein